MQTLVVVSVVLMLPLSTVGVSMRCSISSTSDDDTYICEPTVNDTECVAALQVMVSDLPAALVDCGTRARFVSVELHTDGTPIMFDMQSGYITISDSPSNNNRSDNFTVCITGAGAKRIFLTEPYETSVGFDATYMPRYTARANPEDKPTLCTVWNLVIEWPTRVVLARPTTTTTTTTQPPLTQPQRTSSTAKSCAPHHDISFMLLLLTCMIILMGVQWMYGCIDGQCSCF